MTRRLSAIAPLLALFVSVSFDIRPALGATGNCVAGGESSIRQTYSDYTTRACARLPLTPPRSCPYTNVQVLATRVPLTGASSTLPNFYCLGCCCVPPPTYYIVCHRYSQLIPTCLIGPEVMLFPGFGSHIPLPATSRSKHGRCRQTHFKPTFL